jgi:hypothetical protein
MSCLGRGRKEGIYWLIYKLAKSDFIARQWNVFVLKLIPFYAIHALPPPFILNFFGRRQVILDNNANQVWALIDIH